MSKTLVNLESPYAGDIERNLLYARFCMRDSIVNHNEAPFASHLLYTQPHILHDDIPEERALGISTGLEFAKITSKTVVYVDLGVSVGMQHAIQSANKNGICVETRRLSTEYWNKFFEEVKAIEETTPITIANVRNTIIVSTIIAILITFSILILSGHNILGWFN